TSLWCHQGGDRKHYKPVGCDTHTIECYKFVCSNGQWPFVARGCGSSTLAITSTENHSCSQAIEQCDYLGGIGTCVTCGNEHLCNHAITIHRPFILFLFPYIIFKTIM
uniref:Chitin-binding type-2 domain-containing protein n=1 Tax=Ascaris lumbricoides TaxID=6252 RepID=A0A0M3IER5_ASCLU